MWTGTSDYGFPPTLRYIFWMSNIALKKASIMHPFQDLLFAPEFLWCDYVFSFFLVLCTWLFQGSCHLCHADILLASPLLRCIFFLFLFLFFLLCFLGNRIPALVAHSFVCSKASFLFVRKIKSPDLGL